MARTRHSSPLDASPRILAAPGTPVQKRARGSTGTVPFHPRAPLPSGHGRLVTPFSLPTRGGAEGTGGPAAVFANDLEHVVAVQRARKPLKRRADELHLVQQAPDSPLHPAPGFRLPGRRLRLWPSNPNCTIHLEGHTLASWFASLPKSHKHNVARLGRRLLSAGQVDMIWSDDRVVLPALLDLYLDVERHSWKAGAAVGIGRSPERVALFRQQLEAGRSARAVVHLLRLDGTPIAGHVGIWFGGELHAREIAFDERLSALGPGLMMMLLVVRGALEEGARRINLLSRFGYYKKEWGAEVQPTETVQFFRVGSVAWARSWFGDLKRRLGPRGEEGRAERVNAARRATVKAPPAEALPQAAEPADASPDPGRRSGVAGAADQPPPSSGRSCLSIPEGRRSASASLKLRKDEPVLPASASVDISWFNDGRFRSQAIAPAPLSLR